MDEQNYCSDAENTNSALEDEENAPADIIPAKWWLESFENKKLPRDAIAMYRLLLTCPGFHVDTVQAYLQNFEKLRNTCLAAMTVLRQSLSAPSDQRRATKLVTHLRVIASGEHALLESKLLHEHMLRRLVREGSGEFGHGFDGFSKLEASRLGAARLFVDDYVEGRDPKKRRIESDPDHNPFAPPLSPAKNTTPSPPPKGIPTLFTPEVEKHLASEYGGERAGVGCLQASTNGTINSTKQGNILLRVFAILATAFLIRISQLFWTM
ncbi:hypothetical protein DFS34DRAFT_668949 [Phlyctochytrium arcticum]|nr:hypothetical protein DFS34DRAFT_668949 [Phlyctochytrium arcticum]